MKEKTRIKLEKIVENSYKETAEEFNVTRQKEIWPKLKEMTNLVFDGAKVLDLGCGNGRLLKVLQEKNLKYLGCDQEEQLIKIAKTNWPKNNFIVTKIPAVPDKKFDYIFSIAVIHHIPSSKHRTELLKKLKNHLNNKGKIIISVWNLRKSRRILVYKSFIKHILSLQLEFGDVLFPWKKNHGQKLITRYYHAFSKKSLKKLAEKAGYEIEKIEEDKYNIWLVLSSKTK
jgi:2-polyprenyl-3-methyl-5-hydroxy-6-metoxy-1,4-benzoquinol methylase